jgi:hypothetical protein
MSETDQLPRLHLRLIFLGPATHYIPYYYAAIKQAGENGLLRERAPFSIRAVTQSGVSILRDDDNLDMSRESSVWEYRENGGMGPVEKTLMIQMLSPLRFKAGGRYSSRFSAAEFALCLHRRAQTLCAQYGSGEGVPDYRFTGGWDISDDQRIWKDYEHYSARQRRPMQLGGVLGAMTLRGSFSHYELALLRFAETFHAGKNTNFGLGTLAVWERQSP